MLEVVSNVSVIVPFYNREPYLRRCLLSILAHPVHEILAINDGSKDGGEQIVLELAEVDPRIKLLSLTKNQGRSVARNVGLKSATGTWIAFCDSDDYYLPNRFDKTFLKLTADIDGVYETIETQFAEQACRNYFSEIYTGVFEKVEPENLLDFLIQHDDQRISLNGFCIKKAAADKVGLYDEGLFITEDTDWIWRAASTCKLISSDSERAVAVRWVDENHAKPEKDASLYKSRCYHKWINHPDISVASKRILAKKYGYFCAEHQFRALAFLRPLARIIYRNWV